MTKTFTTDLRCGGCVAAIAPDFDGADGVRTWSVALDQPGKPITVEGEGIDRARVETLLNRHGYHTRDEVIQAAMPSAEPPTSLFPLALIVGYLLGVSLLAEAAFGTFDAMRVMRHFMAGFFLVFSFFKMLDITAFADSYAMYDLIAQRSRAYSRAYPFVELALGIAYLLNVWPTATNAVTLVLMLVGSAGVLRSLLAKRKIRCACLGAVFNLPMTLVTLVEDGLMAAMAAVALLR